jgi:predicted O-methyltransferase YrrM
MTFKRFFFYLFNDPFWIVYPLLKLIYNFKKKKLLDSYYKNQLDILLSKFDNVVSEEAIDQYTAIKPDLDKQIRSYPLDLSRLYNLIRTEKPFTVLEFGVGYSTLIIAKALK